MIFLKKINDEFGHNAGDEVLISFANLTKTILGVNDSSFRYGSEEFITISTRISIEEATRLPNRLRKNLEEKASHGSVQKIITCSGGVSYWQPSDSSITPEKLIKKADTELYKAKSFGRNCIVMNGAVCQA